MARFYIEAMYEYRGEVEARTAEEAEAIFLEDLNDYYYGTYSIEIEELWDSLVELADFITERFKNA